MDGFCLVRSGFNSIQSQHHFCTHANTEIGCYESESMKERKKEKDLNVGVLSKVVSITVQQQHWQYTKTTTT